MHVSVLILMGETASGKSDLALRLAEYYDAEIIGADSRQMYRGMEIGTAAPTPRQRARRPHHLVSFLDPGERYSAARFAQDSCAFIHDIHQRGRRVILVGGTGFYIRVLCGEMALGTEHHQPIRERLRRENRLHSPEWMYEWLRLLDPERAAQLHAHDTYRITRSLEIALSQRTLAAQPTSVVDEVPTLPKLGVGWRKFWVAQSPQQLETRIQKRSAEMLERGFIAEAERIGSQAVAASAVGYLNALAYLKGFATYPELLEQLMRATRQYAKRQRTWLRREPGLEVLPAELAFEEQCVRIGRSCGWVTG